MKNNALSDGSGPKPNLSQLFTLKININCCSLTESSLSQLHIGGSYRFLGLFVAVQHLKKK